MPNKKKRLTSDQIRMRGIRRRFALVVFDALTLAFLSYATYLMTNWAIFSHLTMSLPVAMWICGNVCIGITIFALFRLYSMTFSTAGVLESVRILCAVACLGLVNCVYIFCIDRHHYYLGYSTVLFFCTLLCLAVVASRFVKRIFETVRSYFLVKKRGKTRVMVIGGGDAGITLIRKAMFNENSAFKPVCILDDNPMLKDKLIYDVRVVGETKDVAEYAKKYRVDEIIVAMPSVGKERIRQILNLCKECKKPIKLLPESSKTGDVGFAKLRQVQVQDLLGREQIQTNLDEVMGYIEGKVVLVTGGGGSIGSELCRQIALHNPQLLIILDIYENNAYDIEQELKTEHPSLNLLALIASIRDKRKVRDVFEKYRPQIVFNAAAHKHVPLMETSPNEAVKNNVFGTLNVAQAADEYGVETFVQISTDKAVNPTNIMGASKRICEMIIQTIGKHSKNTKFVAVRFGNVLGSNGSVIPLFKKQIMAGGPVTVTHKDIIRYFMTIPEAVSLVLQAGVYAKSGQIFVLDMGEPVKIYDLAYNLIKLSGFEPNVDIDIKITGLRPGEKLYEERLMAEEGLQKTPNGLISIAQPIEFDEAAFWSSLDRLYEAAHDETDKMKDWVQALVPTYKIDRRESPMLRFIHSETETNIEKEENAGA